MAEGLTSLAWIAAKNSLITTRPGEWWISGGSMTKKHSLEFAGKLLNSFPLFEVSLQGLTG
jgi:hypothetical protein